MIEMPKDARQFTQTPYKLKRGLELWGTATGRSIPYHRQWWVVQDGEPIAHLDQGYYENGLAAATQRYVWLRDQGFIEKVVGKDDAGNWVWKDPS